VSECPAVPTETNDLDLIKQMVGAYELLYQCHASLYVGGHWAIVNELDDPDVEFNRLERISQDALGGRYLTISLDGRQPERLEPVSARWEIKRDGDRVTERLGCGCCIIIKWDRATVNNVDYFPAEGSLYDAADRAHDETCPRKLAADKNKRRALGGRW